MHKLMILFNAFLYRDDSYELLSKNFSSRFWFDECVYVKCAHNVCLTNPQNACKCLNVN